MGAASTYLTAVVAGAMTAGIAAANVVAVPPDTVYRLSHRRGTSTWPRRIPIIDFDETVGPLTTFGRLSDRVGTNPLLLGIIQQGGKLV